MRIALVAPAYAGKSTLASVLEEEHGWTYINYTDSLKHFLVTGLNAIESQIARSGKQSKKHTVGRIHQNKKDYRRITQALGDFLGYKDGFYVQEMLNQWQALGSPSPVVWDNVRFPAQAEILREHGFVMVGLAVSKDIQLERAKLCGVTGDELRELSRDTSEQGLGALCDIQMDGDNDTGVLADILNRMAGAYLPREASVKAA